jgi:uroporphyrin-III C-methyltransferase
MNSENIKVYMVGAGPGSPELLTIKAHKLLSMADLVLHDDLVSPEIIAIIPGSAMRFNVGKRYGDGKDQARRCQEIVELISGFGSPSKLIVRLKGGDPMIFSRSVEEIEAMQMAGISVEIVPGITSGIAAGSLAQIPLTERMSSEGIMMVTGSTANERVEHMESIVRWLQIGNTVLLYMGFKRFRELSSIMFEQGLRQDLPACAVSNVSLPGQKALLGTIRDLPEKAEMEDLQMPVVILLGEGIRMLID